jgi:CRP-like cAMP-binding protein
MSAIACLPQLVQARQAGLISTPGSSGIIITSVCSHPMDKDRVTRGRKEEETKIGNLILRGLPQKECTQLFNSMELMRLKPRQLMHEAGDTIRSGYFLNNGLASVLMVQPDGGAVEVCLIGREGFVGLPVIFGFRTSGVRVVTQVEGTAYRVDVDTLERILPQCPELESLLQCFSMILGMESMQMAACNRLHDVEERLASKLLMSHERIGGKTLPFTQELLAQMLGTRRSGVTVAAGILQKAGMIEYKRGCVTIVDKAKLEGAACDCYQIIQRQKTKWQAET